MPPSAATTLRKRDCFICSQAVGIAGGFYAPRHPLIIAIFLLYRFAA